MKTLYAVRDRIANDLPGGAYAVTQFRTDAQAVRYFGDSINTEKTSLNAHPHDYELIKLGEIDEDGTITALQTPTIIITGTALKELQQPPAEPTHDQILQFQREA